MKLTPKQIQDNWSIFLNNIEVHITDDRKQKLLNFYKKYEDRIVLMPASHKKEYHNAFPGGYVEHVNRVVRCALKQYTLWKEEGADVTTFTEEELVFSAINHDLGKMGDDEQDSYIPQTDKWRKEKLGEDYTFNNKVPFASVPDRGLFMLQQHDIKYNFNEMVAIQTHDGLYDPANDKYLKGWMPEQKPRTSLPFILHQADMMAARIEFEREWLPKFNNQNKSVGKQDKNHILGGTPNTKTTRDKALSSIKSDSLKNMLEKL
tara:strand:+ start:2884 stop:3669 length:786 start_codon:yes stop_codon:yes gene_type:complete